LYMEILVGLSISYAKVCQGSDLQNN